MAELHRTSMRCLSNLLSLTLLTQSISCGTLLYPERIGQTRGPLDPAVVALDAVGLLLFVVPGAIAFAVDFYNGTIYLPSGTYRGQSPAEIEKTEWTSIQLPPEVDSYGKLQKFLSSRVGHSVQLGEMPVEIYRLSEAPTQTRVKLDGQEESRSFHQIDWETMLAQRRQTAQQKTSSP